MSNIDPAQDARYLLQVFEQHVKRQMMDTLRPMLEKVLEDEVTKAVASLQKSLESYHNAANDVHMVRVILEDKRVKK